MNSQEKQAKERYDAAVAQLLIEIAFLLPIGTNVRQHPIAAKLTEVVAALRALCEHEANGRHESAP